MVLGAMKELRWLKQLQTYISVVDKLKTIEKVIDIYQNCVETKYVINILVSLRHSLGMFFPSQNEKSRALTHG